MTEYTTIYFSQKRNHFYKYKFHLPGKMSCADYNEIRHYIFPFWLWAGIILHEFFFINSIFDFSETVNKNMLKLGGNVPCRSVKLTSSRHGIVGTHRIMHTFLLVTM